MKSVQIHFGHLDVNSINNSSGVFFGSNLQLNFRLSSKANNGFLITGHKNKVNNNLCSIRDDDGLEITTV
jgi:hypothetical protein